MFNTNSEMTKSIIVGLRGGKKLTEIPASFLDIRDVILAAVSKDGMQLADAPDCWKSDPHIVLAAINQNGLALQYASESLKNHKGIVHAAIMKDVDAFFHASNELQSDKDIANLVVNLEGMMLQYLPSTLKHNKKIVLTALISDNRAIRFVPKDLTERTSFFWQVWEDVDPDKWQSNGQTDPRFNDLYVNELRAYIDCFFYCELFKWVLGLALVTVGAFLVVAGDHHLPVITASLVIGCLSIAIGSTFMMYKGYHYHLDFDDARKNNSVDQPDSVSKFL